jgi:hypothetical protein
VPLSRNLGTLTSLDPLGHSRPVTGLLYFCYIYVLLFNYNYYIIILYIIIIIIIIYYYYYYYYVIIIIIYIYIIIGSPECPCKQGIPTVDRLIFQCRRLKNEGGILKNTVLKIGEILMDSVLKSRRNSEEQCT